MDNTVKKKLSVFRKRQTVFVIIYGLINVAVIDGIIAYYRLKEQALAVHCIYRIMHTVKHLYEKCFHQG